jgi:hypothetical protein
VRGSERRGLRSHAPRHQPPRAALPCGAAPSHGRPSPSSAPKVPAAVRWDWPRRAAPASPRRPLALRLVRLSALTQRGPVNDDLRSIGGIEADRHNRPDALHTRVLGVKPILELGHRAVLEGDPDLDVVGAGRIHQDLAVVGLDQNTIELRAVPQKLPIAKHEREFSLRSDIDRHAVSRRRWCSSGRPDLIRGPHRPERCALPGCATPREAAIIPDQSGNYLTASIAASISASVGLSCKVRVPLGPLTIIAWPVRIPRFSPSSL